MNNLLISKNQKIRSHLIFFSQNLKVLITLAFLLLISLSHSPNPIFAQDSQTNPTILSSVNVIKIGIPTRLSVNEFNKSEEHQTILNQINKTILEKIRKSDSKTQIELVLGNEYQILDWINHQKLDGAVLSPFSNYLIQRRRKFSSAVHNIPINYSVIKTFNNQKDLYQPKIRSFQCKDKNELIYRKHPISDYKKFLRQTFERAKQITGKGTSKKNKLVSNGAEHYHLYFPTHFSTSGTFLPGAYAKEWLNGKIIKFKLANKKLESEKFNQNIARPIRLNFWNEYFKHLEFIIGEEWKAPKDSIFCKDEVIWSESSGEKYHDKNKVSYKKIISIQFASEEEWLISEKGFSHNSKLTKQKNKDGENSRFRNFELKNWKDDLSQEFGLTDWENELNNWAKDLNALELSKVVILKNNLIADQSKNQSTSQSESKPTQKKDPFYNFAKTKVFIECDEQNQSTLNECQLMTYINNKFFDPKTLNLDFPFTLGEIMRLLHQNQNKTGKKDFGLVLSGGGVKSAYQTKLIDHLYKNNYVQNIVQNKNQSQEKDSKNTVSNPEKPINVKKDAKNNSKKPIDVKYVLGNSGGALLGMFVSAQPRNSNELGKLSSVLWGEEEKERESNTFVNYTDIFRHLNPLKWGSLLLCVLILSALLFMASLFVPKTQLYWDKQSFSPEDVNTLRQKYPNLVEKFQFHLSTSYKDKHSRWRFSLSWIGLLILPPLIIKLVNGNEGAEHVPEIEGFFYFLLLLIAIFADNCFITKRNNKAFFPIYKKIYMALLYTGVALIAIPFFLEQIGLITPPWVTLQVIYPLIGLTIIFLRVKTTLELRNENQNPNHLFLTLFSIAGVLLILIPFAYSILPAMFKDHLNTPISYLQYSLDETPPHWLNLRMLYIGIGFIFYFWGKKIQEKPNFWEAVSSNQLSKVWRKNFFSYLFLILGIGFILIPTLFYSSYKSYFSSTVFMAPIHWRTFWICIGFFAIYLANFYYYKKGENYFQFTDWKALKAIGFLVAFIVLTYLIMCFVDLMIPLSFFELSASFWIALSTTALFLAIAIYSFSFINVKTDSLFYKPLRYTRENLKFLYSHHPAGNLRTPRYIRIVLFFGLGWLWWNLIIGPGVYGNGQAKYFFNGKVNQFVQTFIDLSPTQEKDESNENPSNKDECDPYQNICETPGDLKLNTLFAVPANVLSKQEERYFLFKPENGNTTLNNGDIEYNNGVHRDERWRFPNKKYMTSLVFSSGSPFPIFPPHYGFYNKNIKKSKTIDCSKSKMEKVKISSEIEKKCEHEWLVDGGFAHNIPIEAARDLGVKQALVINSSPPDPIKGDCRGKDQMLFLKKISFIKDNNGKDSPVNCFWGELIRSSPRILPFLFEKSQGVDQAAQGDMMIAELAPRTENLDWPYLWDFRKVQVKYLQEQATKHLQLNARIGRILHWGLPDSNHVLIISHGGKKDERLEKEKNIQNEMVGDSRSIKQNIKPQVKS